MGQSDAIERALAQGQIFSDFAYRECAQVGRSIGVQQERSKHLAPETGGGFSDTGSKAENGTGTKEVMDRFMERIVARIRECVEKQTGGSEQIQLR